MSLARYLLGVVELAAMAASLAVAAWSLRRRVLPHWTGSPARLAEIVLALGTAVAVSELLGIAGLLRPLPTLLAFGAAAGAARSWISPPLGPTGESVRRAPRVDAWSGYVALAVVAVVLAQWGARSLAAVDRGIWLDDSLWYHLPLAQAFIQRGSIMAIRYTSAEPLTAFYPANSALVQALGILPFHREFLAPLLNLGWAGLALLAGWSFGRPYGRAPEALVAVAIVLAVPVMTLTQPGAADDDVMALALFLASIALLVNGWSQPATTATRRRAADVVAGLAAGLAAGTKLTALGPVLALTVAVIVLARRDRAAAIASWILAAAVGGAFWFVRNIAVTGSPVPQLRLGFGPLSLPHNSSQTEDLIGAPASRYLLDPHFWRTVFRPYLAYDLGPLWLVILALGALGMLWAMGWARDAMARTLGVLGVTCVALYLVTPTTGGAFVENVRFATPALAIGLLLAAVRLPGWGPTGGRRVLAAIATLLLVTVIDFEVHFHSLVGTALAGAAIGAGSAIVLAALRRRGTVLLAVAAAAVVVVVAGYAAERQYLSSAYGVPPQPRSGRFTSQPLADVIALYRWARPLRHVRIALAGFYTQSPLYGSTLSNAVDYLGARRVHGGFSPLTSCAGWRRALRLGHYQYVVTAPRGGPAAGHRPEPAEARWTRAAPGVVEIARGPGPLSLFRIDAQVTSAGCPS